MPSRITECGHLRNLYKESMCIISCNSIFNTSILYGSVHVMESVEEDYLSAGRVIRDLSQAEPYWPHLYGAMRQSAINPSTGHKHCQAA